MVLWGWMRRPTILGSKLDQCPVCGAVGPHALVRNSYWFHLFWVPVIFFRLKHVLVCANCGKTTDIPLNQVRKAFRSATLPLTDRIRPAWPEMQNEIWDKTGKRPNEADVFDPLTRNEHRGFFDLYVKAWPVLVAVLLAFAIILPRQFATVTGQPEQYGTGHTCWSDTAQGDLVGCRLKDGTMQGRTGATTVTCYFDEPLLENTDVRCR